MKQKLMKLKGKLDNWTIVEYFNNPLSITERTSAHKFSKCTEDVKNNIYRLDQTYNAKADHPMTAEHIFFSNAHWTLSYIDRPVKQVSINVDRLKLCSKYFMAVT